MSFWSKMVDGFASSVPGWLGSIADWALGQFSGLSKAQQQQNQYASLEAEKARQFNAQQAELEREWQEEQTFMYNSLQGKIAQAKEAGVNPLFAVTGSAVSPASSAGASASSSPASSAPVSSPRLNPAMMEQALGFSKLSAEIDNIKSITRRNNAEALTSEINNLTQGELNKQNIASIVKSIEKADVEIEFKNAQIREIASKIMVNDATIEEKSANIALLTSEVLLNGDRSRLIDAQIREIASQIGLNEEQSKYYAKAVDKLASEIKGLDLDNVVKDKTVFSRVDQEAYAADILEFERDLAEAGFDVEKWIAENKDLLFEAQLNNVAADTKAMNRQVFKDIAMLLIFRKMASGGGSITLGGGSKPNPIGF